MSLIRRSRTLGGRQQMIVRSVMNNRNYQSNILFYFNTTKTVDESIVKVTLTLID